MSDQLKSRIRHAIWGCELPWMGGDNLAVTICTVIQDYIKCGPSDDETGWPLEVNEAYQDTENDLVSRILSAVSPLRTRAEAAEARVGELEARDAAMRGVVEAAWRVDACEDPEADETAQAFYDLRKRLAALDAFTKAEG